MTDQASPTERPPHDEESAAPATTSTSSLPSKLRPKLQANAFFPKHDTKDFELDLSYAVLDLQNDTTSGARQLADSALKHLEHFADLSSNIALTSVEFWTLMVRAGKQLCAARPSMGAAVTACLLRVLSQIVNHWTEDELPRESDPMANFTANLIEDTIKERQDISQRLGESFTKWLQDNCGAEVRIATLSNSSTIRNAVLLALASLPDVTFRLKIFESRPRCEGADMAAQLFAAASEHKTRLHISIVPDCAVGQAVFDINLVLLGADRISSAGDVSNKIGSLSAAICAKSRKKKVPVVVLSDTDKIAASGEEQEVPETHPAKELTAAWAEETREQLEGEENMEVFGEWFEWVPAQLVDAYVTERGVLKVEDVERLAQEVKDLEESVFGSSEM